MAVIDAITPEEEVRNHRKTFMAFERLVMFAAMHIALVLVSLAIAFFGHAHVFAFLLGAGGTVALIAGFAITSPSRR